MKTLSNVVLILSDARGVFIPRDFLTDNRNELAIEHCNAWGLNETNWDKWIDASAPESEFYWDAWEWVLNNANYVEESTGKVFTLHQDGCLWGICYEFMTEEEKQAFGFED